MEKLDLEQVNQIMSQTVLSGTELKSIVDYFLREQDKKFQSIKANDLESEKAKEIALIEARTWSLVQEMFKGDDIEIGINNNWNKEDNNIEIEVDRYQNSSVNRIAQACVEQESEEKQLFYYLFNETWYSKTDKQRMQYNAYDQRKMPNFLCNSMNTDNSIEGQNKRDLFVSLEQSKGMLADRSYSDLEIIEDIVFFDNHLQRFSKVLKWIQTQCLFHQVYDVQHSNNSTNGNSLFNNNKVSLVNLSTNKQQNDQLLSAYQLLKRRANKQASKLLQDNNQLLAHKMLQSVFPHHDFQLSDCNSFFHLKSKIVLSEIKQQFLGDVFYSEYHTDNLRDRLIHYKKHSFNSNQIYDQQIGNINWLSSIKQALQISISSNTSGEIAFFGYLSSNLEGLSSLINNNHINQWYEMQYVTIKYLYFHEILKRFLVIKGLLFESCEQFYPVDSSNCLVDFYDSPAENYRKITLNQGIENDIYLQLQDQLQSGGPAREDKYMVQILLLLAYLKPSHLVQQQNASQWNKLVSYLSESSNSPANNLLSLQQQQQQQEFNAKLIFCLLNSQYIVQPDNFFYNEYNNILQKHTLTLMQQDRQQEAIVYAKILPDERMCYQLMGRYLGWKKQDAERRKLRNDMMNFGYTQDMIQNILKELVNSTFNEPSSNFANGDGLNDNGILDGLKMFIESYSNNLHVCMQHCLIAARSFFQQEKLPLYNSIREDKDISFMIEKYEQQQIQQLNEVDRHLLYDLDPFLHELRAYDQITSCHKLLDQLKNIHKSVRNFGNKKESYNHKADEEALKGSEFIDQCKQTFFRTNSVTRKRYILIDTDIQFEDYGLLEFNPHNMTKTIFQQLTAYYLKKAMTKSIEVANAFPVFQSICYFSPSYNAFTYFVFDDQESVIKNAATLLSRDPLFMSTVLDQRAF